MEPQVQPESLVPSSYVRQVEEGTLPGPVLVELLRAVLERDAPFRFIAPGFSMSPFIRHGDTVTVEPVGERALRVGNVVAFLRPDSDRLVIHRLIGEEDGAWLVRGDNCPDSDGRVLRENVIGVVTRVDRRGHRVHLALERGGRWVAWLNARNWLSPLRTVFYFPLRVGGALLRRLQRTSAFRTWAKRFRPAYVIREANAIDQIVVHAWANPGGESPPYRHNPNVTDYVARRGDEVMGFIQLVRRSATHGPYSGYWLHSLMVRTRYRGLGLGEALSQRVVEQAQAEDAPELLLNVFADNAPAIALYHKLGFERVMVPALEARFGTAAQRGERRMMTMRKELG
jgi:signal peptidase I